MNAELYALTHRGNPGDIAFYGDVCRGAKSVLELGSGSGRLLLALSSRQASARGARARSGAARLGQAQLARTARREAQIGARAARRHARFHAASALRARAPAVQCAVLLARQTSRAGLFSRGASRARARRSARLGRLECRTLSPQSAREAARTTPSQSSRSVMRDARGTCSSARAFVGPSNAWT